MYIYVYIYTHTCIYISYIYIYARWAAVGLRELPLDRIRGADRTP